MPQAPKTSLSYKTTVNFGFEAEVLRATDKLRSSPIECYEWECENVLPVDHQRKYQKLPGLPARISVLEKKEKD